MALGRGSTRGLGLLSFPDPMKTAAAPAQPREYLRCPRCDWEWRFLPRPPPIPGYVPMQYTCPNRHCRERHWIILHKVVLAPQLRWRVVRRVPCLGQDPQAMRRTLNQIPELDRDAIELYLAMHELDPQEAAP